MAIVSGQDLNDFMSNPPWTDDQHRQADKLCRQLESSLAAALGGAPIDPIPWVEEADILDKGLVSTRYPVHAVRKIDTTTIAEGDPLPEPFMLQGHWLRLKPGTSWGITSPFTPGITSVSLDGLAGLAGFGAGSVYEMPRSSILGRTLVEYDAGWGPEGALELAILRKAEAIFGWRNSDTVQISGTNADKAPARPSQDWTEDELKKLDVFRTITITR